MSRASLFYYYKTFIIVRNMNGICTYHYNAFLTLFPATGADLGGGGGGGFQGFMKNDVMHTVIYAAFYMLPSLDLQHCTSF